MSQDQTYLYLHEQTMQARSGFIVNEVNRPAYVCDICKCVIMCQDQEEHSQTHEIRMSNAKLKGVWIVYGYNPGEYPIGLFETELEALQLSMYLGYGYVKFWEWGEWSDK